MNDLEIDARPILADGGDPFGVIMVAVNQLAAGQRLKLIASFRPEPLFKVMAGKGFAVAPKPLEGGDWQILFSPVSASDPDNPET